MVTKRKHKLPAVFWVMIAVTALVVFLSATIAFSEDAAKTVHDYPCDPALVRQDLDVMRYAYELSQGGKHALAFNWVGEHYAALNEHECES